MIPGSLYIHLRRPDQVGGFTLTTQNIENYGLRHNVPALCGLTTAQNADSHLIRYDCKRIAMLLQDIFMYVLYQDGLLILNRNKSGFIHRKKNRMQEHPIH